MPKEYEASCSDCGTKLKVPFEPTPGRPLFCPYCHIKGNDVRKSPYMVDLVAFLSEKLGLKRGDKLDVVRAAPDRYDILLAKKGSKAKVICVTKWEPKDPERLMIPERMGPVAIVKITVKDASIKQIIQDFISKEGVDATVPQAPLQSF